MLNEREPTGLLLLFPSPEFYKVIVNLLLVPISKNSCLTNLALVLLAFWVLFHRNVENTFGHVVVERGFSRIKFVANTA